MFRALLLSNLNQPQRSLLRAVLSDVQLGLGGQIQVVTPYTWVPYISLDTPRTSRAIPAR
jgi:hypothetical protein